MNPAEAFARATGSVGSTYTVKKVNADGTTTVEEQHEYSREPVVLPHISERTATMTFNGFEISMLVGAVSYFKRAIGGSEDLQALYDRIIMADLEAHREFAELHKLPIDDDEEGPF